jgi:hypothetical protein
LRRERDREGGE